MASTSKRKKELERRVQALSDRRVQVSLDAFLKVDLSSKKRQAGEGPEEHEDTHGKRSKAALGEAPSASVASVPAALVENDGRGERVDCEGRNNFKLTLDLRKVTPEEERNMMVDKVFRLASKNERGRPSWFGRTLDLGKLSLGRSPPTRAYSLHNLKYGLLGRVRSRPAPSFGPPGDGYFGRATRVSLDSRGAIAAVGMTTGICIVHRTTDVRAEARSSSSGAVPILAINTGHGAVRDVQWNPRDENEIAVATGYGRQIRIYDLSRWQEGAAPTRTLDAAMGPSSRAPHPHRGVVSVKHLESMGRYVVAGGTANGELLLWDTRCKFRSSEAELHDLTRPAGDPFGCKAIDWATREEGYQNSLSKMFKTKESLRSRCSLRRGPHAVVSVLECGNHAGVIHACTAKGEILSWDTRKRRTAGFFSSVSSGGGGDYFHPLSDTEGPVSIAQEITRAVMEAPPEGMPDPKSAIVSLWSPSQLVGARPDPADPRRVAFTLSTGVVSVAHATSRGFKVTKVVLDTHNRSDFGKVADDGWKNLPASVRNDPRVARDGRHEEGWDAEEVAVSEWTLGGEALASLESRAGNRTLKLHDASGPGLYPEKPPVPVSLGVNAGHCLASHPGSDEIFLGAGLGDLMVVCPGVHAAGDGM